MPLVTVITPVYNNEKYIRRCIESILSQSYKNLELILVDDGSTDSSGYICDEFASKDNRIKVIHQKNRGVSVARNVGISVATGDYIIFVDSDDYISDKLIDMCVKEVLSQECDILIFNLIEDYGKVKKEQSFNKKYYVSYETFLEGILWDKIPSYPCNKFYKKFLWDNVEYPKNMNFEDLAIMYQIFLKTRKIRYIEEYLYYYNCTNNNSITSNISSKNKYGMFISFYNRAKYAQKEGLNDLGIYSTNRAVKSAVTAYGLNTYDGNLSDAQVKYLLEYLSDFDVNKLNIGIKYKILFYSAFRFKYICFCYGYFMYLYQKIKKMYR